MIPRCRVHLLPGPLLRSLQAGASRAHAGALPSPSPGHTLATPNASVAAPDHPPYPGRPGSTTQPNAETPHHEPHNVTTLSLDLKFTGRKVRTPMCRGETERARDLPGALADRLRLGIDQAA